MPAAEPSPLSRIQLERILGLESGTRGDEMTRVLIRLLMRLEERREAAAASERQALTHEMDRLTTSLVAVLETHGPTFHSGRSDEAAVQSTRVGLATAQSRLARERLLLGAIVLLVCVVIAMFISIVWRDGDAKTLANSEFEIARLIVESRPEDAELRIRPVDSDELILRTTGDGVAVELDPGQYEVEVSREDCPDSWIQVITLEPGETRRYEPTICRGVGELVVRSNLENDRLRIDDLDQGATRAEAHLLGVGDHAIRVDKPGYAPFEATIRVRPDERLELHADLVKLEDGTSEGGTHAGNAPQAAPLPFEVVRPTIQPTSTGSQRAVRRASVAGDLVSDPIVPVQIRPEDLKLPSAVFDFEYFDGPSRNVKGGSTTWHDAISARVLDRYDVDGSGRIDRAAETDSIPCSFWKEIERSFNAGGLGLSMSRLYGFDGSEWHPIALGFARKQRDLAYIRMQACGLAP